MELTTTERGFPILLHEPRLPARQGEERVPVRLVQCSSVVGNYEDAMQRRGTSALWIGESHHLDREEVRVLVGHLQRWLETGAL